MKYSCNVKEYDSVALCVADNSANSIFQFMVSISAFLFYCGQKSFARTEQEPQIKYTHKIIYFLLISIDVVFKIRTSKFALADAAISEKTTKRDTSSLQREQNTLRTECQSNRIKKQYWEMRLASTKAQFAGCEMHV